MSTIIVARSFIAALRLGISVTAVNRKWRVAALSALITLSAIPVPRGEGVTTLVNVGHQEADLWPLRAGLPLMHPDGSNQVRLTYGVETGPTSSPDGSRNSSGGLATQDAVGRFAVDDCYNLWYLEDYEMRCDVIVFDPGVSGSVVGSGVDPALSPDGKRIVFVAATRPDDFAPTDLILVNLEDGSRTKVTDKGLSPTWSADSQQIAFVATSTTGAFELYVANADGSGLRQVTSGIGFRGLPTWSPDDRLAFQCEVETGNLDICSINANGTGFARLTTFAGGDGQPTFSPDGSRIAFVTNRFTPWELAILHGDGTVNRLGAGIEGTSPAWSPDGSRIAFVPASGGACQADGRICYASTYAVNVDGTGVTLLASGANPTWARSPGGFPPSPEFTAACTALACTFDASQSADDGSIVSFAWRFGDGTTGAGLVSTHVYAVPGSFAVELTVVDDSGARGSVSHTVGVTLTNSPPVASFTSACNGSTCTFDASSSSDRDGQIASYEWSFGDGVRGSGVGPAHTYAPGTYTVLLTVVDSAGASGTSSAIVTTPLSVHVGDLDAASAIEKKGGKWTALVTIAIHDDAHHPIAHAIVEGSWSGRGFTSCTTDSTGSCTVETSSIPRSTQAISFAVRSVLVDRALYNAASNHDADRDGDGTRITVIKP